MSQTAVSLLLCSGLTAREEARVGSLEDAILAKFAAYGLSARTCRASTDPDGVRSLDFYGPRGIVASVIADEFLDADTDGEAVRLIALSI